MALSRLGPDLNALPVPRSQESGSPSPSSPSRPPAVGGVQRWGRDLVLSSLSVLLLRGPTSPSLTLASAWREGTGDAPIPARRWLPCWWNGTGAPGDAAAQGSGLEPQLGPAGGALPSIAARPVLDTVYASFCREYPNTCGERRPRTCP